jgi:hypothetical protein
MNVMARVQSGAALSWPKDTTNLGKKVGFCFGPIATAAFSEGRNKTAFASTEAPM